MSDWKAGAIKRRDARSTKTPDDNSKPGPAKKNTRKWCKGKVGVEHKLKCLDYNDAKHAANDFGGKPRNIFAGWKLLACTECGKELDSYCPMTFGLRAPKPPPPWVV